MRNQETQVTLSLGQVQIIESLGKFLSPISLNLKRVFSLMVSSFELKLSFTFDSSYKLVSLN